MSGWLDCPGPRLPVPAVCRILCSKVRGLAGNISDVSVAFSQYDILWCSETFISDMRQVSDGVAGSRIQSPCLVVPGQDASGPRDGCIYERNGYGSLC